MFNKLKLKLTLFNLIVMVIIMTITLSIVYMFMAKGIVMNSERAMFGIANNPRAKFEPHLRQPPNRSFERMAFIVRFDETGKVIDFSPNTPLSEENLIQLIDKVIAKNVRKGKVSIDSGDQYRFLSYPNKNTIVFLNASMEKETLESLLGVLVSTGMLGIILFAVGSIFITSRAIKPIKESMEKQKSFVADASHELRTPLAVIQTNLELVMDNPEEKIKTQMNWLENVKIENQRMTKLVDNLLMLARTDSGQLLLDKQFFNLSQSIEETINSLKPVANEKGILLDCSLENIESFFADHTKIRQLIVILVDNAIKYSKLDGKINISLKNNTNSIDLFISDTGVGIDKEHLEKIFERFYRVDPARSRNSGGVGLGLSIAKWIVKEHGGTIKVTSKVNEGTTFVVNLPKEQ